MHKRIIIASAFILLIICTAKSQSAYFLSNPTLTPDAQTVIFCFEGDLWKAYVNNGQAVRLTAMQGNETSPRVSPDGKWIAFSGRQYGNADVFVMPINGGTINFYGSLPDNYKVVVSDNYPHIGKILSEDEAQLTVLAKQAFDLALFAKGMLK